MIRFGTGAVGIGLCLVIIAASFGAQHRRLGAAAGASASVGDVLLRAVHVEPPAGDRYRQGDDAVVRFAVFGEPDSDDELVDVRSDEAGHVDLRWDRDCDGTADPVRTLPVEDGDVPGVGGVNRGYHLLLVDLDDEIRIGWTVAVRFEFSRAGAVTLDVPVLAVPVAGLGGCPDPRTAPEDPAPGGGPSTTNSTTRSAPLATDLRRRRGASRSVPG